MSSFQELLNPYRDDLPQLSDFQISQLSGHFELLRRWNRKLNLSAIRTEAEIVERHYCESLFLAARLPSSARTIADLGSGAGFPGIPLAVLRPECSVVLIECHGRKSVFLSESVRDIGNVSVVAKRAEEMTDVFDWIVSRAVNLEKLEDWLVSHSRALALLAGNEPPSLTGFEWDTPIRLPWGDHRHLSKGRNVSRETSTPSFT